jgi:hypothetical protein
VNVPEQIDIVRANLQPGSKMLPVQHTCFQKRPFSAVSTCVIT